MKSSMSREKRVEKKTSCLTKPWDLTVVVLDSLKSSVRGKSSHQLKEYLELCRPNPVCFDRCFDLLC